MLARDLQQLYNQLVSGGILSEAEFWKGRQNLLKEALRGSKDARQQAGFKTAMISEQTGEGGSRRVIAHILYIQKISSYSGLIDCSLMDIVCCVAGYTEPHA